MENGELPLDGGDAKPKWAEWAERYGSSERTLKRWAAHGRDRGDDCPLGDAPAMPGWWSRNMAQRIPHKVLLAAGGKEAPAPAVKVAAIASSPGEMREFVGATAEEMGIEATLRRMEDSEVFAHNAWRDAIEAKDENKALICERSFRQLAKEKVLVEEKARAARIATRDLIPREEAEMRISEVHGDMILRFRGLGDRICRAYGLPVTAENEAKWAEVADDFCAALREEVLS